MAGSPGSQTVYTQTAGTTTVNGWVQASSVSIQGGILSGVGTVSLIAGPLSVSSGAIIHPGNSPGILTINGAYNNAGTLAIDILNLAGGPGTGYSQLIVNSTGVSILGGTVQVNLLTGGVVTSGDRFDILHASGGLSGAFAQLAGNPNFYLDYEASDVYLVATPIPPGIILLAPGLAGLYGLRRRMGRKAERKREMQSGASSPTRTRYYPVARNPFGI